MRTSLFWRLQQSLTHSPLTALPSGHILGFGHEHNRADDVVEGTRTVIVPPTTELHTSQYATAFDRHSVMCYPHADYGSPKFRISKCDALGAAFIYGLPNGAPPTSLFDKVVDK